MSRADRYAQLIQGDLKIADLDGVCYGYPRVVIVEIDNFKRITEEEVRPQYETQDGFVWLETVREMGKCFFSGKQQGFVVLEIPLRSGT